MGVAGGAVFGASAPSGVSSVTGAAGFAGRHLVESLLAAGEEVVGCGLSAAPREDDDDPLPCAWVDLDVTDPQACWDVLDEVRPDAVYHLAGVAHVAQAEADSLVVLEGADLIRAFRASDSAEREFCGRCGSKLFYRADAMPEFIWIAAGVFDADPRVRSSHHIFVGSKAPWYAITDALPQHAAFPDGDEH